MSNITIIRLASVDSTNNYAMQLIDANKAHNGLTVTAATQTAGRGQRGRNWVDRPGESLLMSVIITPSLEIGGQFAFNAAVAVAIANVLQKLHMGWSVHIKWPNDIIINDKKAGGLLIENVIRGSKWTHSVIGLGLNVTQEAFPTELPHATSLRIASGQDFEADVLAPLIASAIVKQVGGPTPPTDAMLRYNDLLYHRGQDQKFRGADGEWSAVVLGVLNDGSLQVQTTEGVAAYYHGQVEWVWG